MGTGFQGRKPASAAPAPDSVPEGERGDRTVFAVGPYFFEEEGNPARVRG